MTDQTTAQEFTIQKIYLKDASVEVPNAPQVFTNEWQPESNLELNTESQKIEDGIYDVTLTLTVTTKNAGNTAFLVEVKQAGVFSARGFDEEQMGHMMGSFCPNILFPYAREAVSSLSVRAGFPDLQLAPINFDALYAQHLENQGEGNPPATSDPETGATH
ncbi:MAG: protein-export chaperone SecB [Gammaproteobacteria bacterium]|jgi:preprotein translocase subunit SecB